MLCGCCILPIFIQSFGLSINYRMHILFLLVQIILLLLYIFYFKNKRNILHICISICINMVLALLDFYKPFFNPYFLKFSIKALTLLGLTNICTSIYLNFIRKSGKTCEDKKCNQRH